jgi:hypothetical protein
VNWGAGAQFNVSKSKASYFDYCVIYCEPCIIETELYDLFAGQTILIGHLKVTNNEADLNATHQVDNGWYLEQVHLYAGAESGLQKTFKMFQYSIIFYVRVHLTASLKVIPSSFLYILW